MENTVKTLGKYVNYAEIEHEIINNGLEKNETFDLDWKIVN